jgi:aspartyl/asparaginyl beta-hydroxylase (cupin superfamily)
MEFFGTEKYPQFKCLEENWEKIRKEFDAIKEYASEWNEAELHNKKWFVYGLRYLGEDVKENCDKAPFTHSLCKSIPNMDTFGFSIMLPECEIYPHENEDKDRSLLRCHLGLYTNPNASIMVGDDVYTWNTGEVVVFDDMKKHSAWNRSSTELRVILLIDFKP